MPPRPPLRARRPGGANQGQVPDCPARHHPSARCRRRVPGEV